MTATHTSVALPAVLMQGQAQELLKDGPQQHHIKPPILQEHQLVK
jgi:hypothetical protein